jgi:hypothetical protein
VIAAGPAGKSPLWRIGAWIGGATLILAVLLARSISAWTLSVLLVATGLALTFPHAWVRLHGGPPYVPPLERIRMRPLGVISYVLYAIFIRTPMAIGDTIYTAFWNVVARRIEAEPPAAEQVAAGARPVVVLPEHEDPDWGSPFPAGHAAHDEDDPSGSLERIARMGRERPRRPGPLSRLWGGLSGEDPPATRPEE